MGLAMDPGSRYHRPTRVEPPFGRTGSRKTSSASINLDLTRGETRKRDLVSKPTSEDCPQRYVERIHEQCLLTQRSTRDSRR